jgi:16S rRNA C1402 (ribose-2'-O) methylase RsmI
MPAPAPREVTFAGRGHAAIRGTHAKTIELVRAPAISARATCVVGVAVDAGPEKLAGFVGPVSIRLRAGEHEDALSAVANPRFQPGERLVVRRSGYRSADTFAVHADRGAAGLDRALVAALGHPDARLEVTIRQETPAAEGAGLLTVLALAGDDPAGLAPDAIAETRAAGLLVALDTGAGRVARALAPATPTAALPGGLGQALDALAAGERVVLAGAAETPGLRPPGRDLLVAALAAGTPLHAVGLPAELAAVVLAGLPGERLVLGGRLGRDRAVRAAALAAVAAGATGVWRAAPGLLVAWLGEVEARLGGGAAAVLLDPGGPGETVLRGDPATVRRALAAAGRRQAEAVVVLAPPSGPPAGPAAELAGVLAALLRQGVPARTLAVALAGQPGWSRREAYATVLALKGGAAGQPPVPRRDGD